MVFESENVWCQESSNLPIICFNTKQKQHHHLPVFIRLHKTYCWKPITHKIFSYLSSMTWRHGFYEPIRITNSQFGSSPIPTSLEFSTRRPTATYATCWAVTGSWFFGSQASWQGQMMKPVQSRQRYEKSKFTTTMSIFLNLFGIPCNRCSSMKRATLSAMGSRMKECSLLVIIWMSGQGVMKQQKWHNISMLA